MNATDLKAEGNLHFSKKEFHDAISCYTKAIIHDPSIATFYTNRALCYVKLNMWDQACQDCQRAIDLDNRLVKAHFFKGQALHELQLFDESIASFKRAFDLAKEQQLNFAGEVVKAMHLARKKKWILVEEKRLQEEIELQTDLNILLTAEKDRQVEMVKRLKGNGSKDEIQQVEDRFKEKMQQVEELFAQVDDRRTKREVPDVLCCKISFEIMREPVITPSGITYERKDIEEHLQKIGLFDPITRRDLTPGQLVPNLALKEVIQNFIKDNPWAEFY